MGCGIANGMEDGYQEGQAEVGMNRKRRVIMEEIRGEVEKNREETVCASKIMIKYNKKMMLGSLTACFRGHVRVEVKVEDRGCIFLQNIT